jgi:hypothetical protein
MERVKHDVAWTAALEILAVFLPLLREEERRDAFGEIYDRVKAALHAYDRENKSLLHRLRPMSN